MRAVALCLFLYLATLSTAQQISCTDAATYDVVAQCNWTSVTHPTDYPSSAHFSPMCGTVHNSAYEMWKIGGTATPGVQLIAETGSCSTFAMEVAACEANNNCFSDNSFSWQCVAAVGGNPSVCTFTGSFDVSNAYRRVSMLSMLAPSPDWIIGLSSIYLCQEDADNNAEYWRTTYPDTGTRSLNAIDAGTDSGMSFLSPNMPLDDKEPIRSFDARDSSNIFYNPQLNDVLPICEIRLTLKTGDE